MTNNKNWLTKINHLPYYTPNTLKQDVCALQLLGLYILYIPVVNRDGDWLTLKYFSISPISWANLFKQFWK